MYNKRNSQAKVEVSSRNDAATVASGPATWPNSCGALNRMNPNNEEATMEFFSKMNMNPKTSSILRVPLSVNAPQGAEREATGFAGGSSAMPRQRSVFTANANFDNKPKLNHEADPFVSRESLIVTTATESDKEPLAANAGKSENQFARRQALPSVNAADGPAEGGPRPASAVTSRNFFAVQRPAMPFIARANGTGQIAPRPTSSATFANFILQRPAMRFGNRPNLQSDIGPRPTYAGAIGNPFVRRPSMPFANHANSQSESEARPAAYTGTSMNPFVKRPNAPFGNHANGQNESGLRPPNTGASKNPFIQRAAMPNANSANGPNERASQNPFNLQARQAVPYANRAGIENKSGPRAGNSAASANPFNQRQTKQANYRAANLNTANQAPAGGQSETAARATNSAATKNPFSQRSAGGTVTNGMAQPRKQIGDCAEYQSNARQGIDMRRNAPNAPNANNNTTGAGARASNFGANNYRQGYRTAFTAGNNDQGVFSLQPTNGSSQALPVRAGYGSVQARQKPAPTINCGISGNAERCGNRMPTVVDAARATIGYYQPPMSLPTFASPHAPDVYWKKFSKAAGYVLVNGCIQFHLRENIRIEFTIDGSIRLVNTANAVAMAVSVDGISSAFIHPNGRFWQTDAKVDVVAYDGNKTNNYVRFAKFSEKGVCFSSQGRPLIYVVDAAGTRTTADKFENLSGDKTLTVLYAGARSGSGFLEEAQKLLDSAVEMTDVEKEISYLFNGFQIKQGIDGLVTITKNADAKFLLKASPRNGSVTLNTSYIHSTASLGNGSHLFLRSGDKRIHFDGLVFTVRNAGNSACFNEANKVSVN